jgi:hypothetical protein
VSGSLHFSQLGSRIFLLFWWFINAGRQAMGRFLVSHCNYSSPSITIFSVYRNIEYGCCKLETMFAKFVFDVFPAQNEFRLITNYFCTARETCQTLRSAQPVLCEDHHPALTVRNFRHLVLVATPQSFESFLFPLISTNCVFHPVLDLLLTRPGLHPSPSSNAVTLWPTHYVVPIPSACIISFYYNGV